MKTSPLKKNCAIPYCGTTCIALSLSVSSSTPASSVIFQVLVVVGLLSFPAGVIQFVLGYHWPHDLLHIPTAVCLAVLVGIYLVISIWGLLHTLPTDVRDQGQRQVRRADKADGVGQWHYDECFLAICIHFVSFILLALFSDAEHTTSVGRHQTLGPSIGAEGSLGQYHNDPADMCQIQNNFTWGAAVLGLDPPIPHGPHVQAMTYPYSFFGLNPLTTKVRVHARG